MTPTITYADAGNNIVRHATEGRLIQGKWHKRNGQELACLLGVTQGGRCEPSPQRLSQ